MWNFADACDMLFHETADYQVNKLLCYNTEISISSKVCKSRVLRVETSTVKLRTKLWVIVVCECNRLWDYSNVVNFP